MDITFLQLVIGSHYDARDLFTDEREKTVMLLHVGVLGQIVYNVHLISSCESSMSVSFVFCHVVYEKFMDFKSEED